MTGVPVDLLVPKDFVFLNFELMDWLGDREAAILLARIKYQADRDGGWWTVTKTEMQADCRLSEWELDRALKCLIAKDCIEWVRASAKDSTRKCRVKVEATGGNLPHPVEEESSRTPSSEKEISIPPSDDGGSSVQSTESRARTRRLTVSQAAAFDEWWEHWPRKVDKGNARKAYAKALTITDSTCLLSGLLAQVETLKEALKPEHGHVYCPYPATWLNGERWNDEVTPRIVLPDRSDWHAWRERQPGETKNQWMDRVYGVEG